MRDKTHSYEGHDSCIYGTELDVLAVLPELEACAVCQKDTHVYENDLPKDLCMYEDM